MTQILEGKVAVVTGASKGIGTAIARTMAAEGAAVVVHYRSGRTEADQLVAAIFGEGGQAIPVRADMATEADIRRLFADTVTAFGRLDILVNNAGIYEFAPPNEITPAHFHRQFDLNVLGLILACQEAARYFGPEEGSVINISPSQHVMHLPPLPSTVPPRQRSTPRPTLCPRSSGGARSASTPSTQAWWKRKVSARLGSIRPTFVSSWRPERRWAASATPRTSRRHFPGVF